MIKFYLTTDLYPGLYDCHYIGADDIDTQHSEKIIKRFWVIYLNDEESIKWNCSINLNVKEFYLYFISQEKKRELLIDCIL